MGKPFRKRLTFEERRLIEKHIKNGFNCTQTAKLIGRSKNGVVSEVRRGGGANYSAEAGQKISDDILKSAYQTLSERNKGNACFSYKERIEHLEMQIEILFNAIKEIVNR